MSYKPCPICGSSKTFQYMKGIFDSETTLVVECKDCGLQFLEPMMTDAEEDAYYSNYYKSQASRHYKGNFLQDIQMSALEHYLNYKAYYSNLVKDASSILEVGCGSGGFVRFLEDINREISYIRCGTL